MKISLLDYSAIRAANAAQANANSFKISVLGQQHNNLMTKADVIYTDKNAKMNERMQSVRESSVRIQNQIRQIQRATERKNSAISSAVKLIDFGINLTSSIIDYNTQADTEAANNLLTDIGSDYGVQLANDVANNRGSYIDADGNVIKSPTLIEIEDSYRQMVENLDVGKKVKEKAMNALDDMFDNAWGDIAADLISSNVTARDNAWNTRLGEAVAEDSKTGVPAITNELIDNTSWLLPSEKEALKVQYAPQIKANYHANETSRIAREQGEESANSYIKSLDIDETAKNSLYSLADTIAKDGDENAQGSIQSYIEQQLDKGVFPVVIQEMIKPQLENMDPSRREAVETTMHQEFYKCALEQFNWPSDMSTLTAEDLRKLKADVDDRGTALLPDMPTELNAMKSAIQKEIDTRVTANAKANVQSMDLVFDMVGAGTISPSAGLATIRELPIYSDLDTSDDEKAAEYMKKLSDVESLVPQAQQYTYKQGVSLLEDAIKETLNLNLEDSEDNAEFIRWADEARSYVLDYIWNTPAEDITTQSLNEAFDKAEEIFLGGTIQNLEAIRSENEGRSLIQQGASDLATGYLEDVTNLLMMMPEGMISQNASGHYDSPSGLVTNYWMELDVAERNLVQQLNLGNPEHWQTVPYRRTNADGTTTEVPIPVLQDTANGTKYTIIGNNFLKQEKDSDEWDVVTAINKSAPLPADDTITPPTSDQIREGQSGIDVSNPPDISEYDDPWVLPTPDEVQQGQKSVVVEDNDGNAFAHLADEGGDIRVRRYKGQGTQFYYQGNWYRVNELPEDSPILKAYDEYMKTFKGTIPKVGY